MARDGPLKLRIVWGAALAFGVIVAGGVYLIRDSSRSRAEIVVPKLSREAKRGRIAFSNHCAECHGVHAIGTDKGPPLVHQFYRPSHHSDVSFTRAVRLGTRQHHWLFGDMPPQPQVKPGELRAVTAYLRELQKANGIF